MITTDPALATFELRIELTALSDGPAIHIGMFGTDLEGQWKLLDDWTPDSRTTRAMAVSEVLTMVDTWLCYGGRRLPA